MAIFSGEMTGGQQDSGLATLGPWGLSNGLLPPLCPHVVLHLSFISPYLRGDRKEDLAGKKSVLPNETCFISPPNSWLNSLLNHSERDTVTFPSPHNTTAMPGSVGSTSFPVFFSVLSQKASRPAQTSSPWVVVAQSLFLPLPLFLGTSPSTLFTLRLEQR